MRSIVDYFSAELDRLRRTGQVFARDNPALARALETHADDPDVERLLEGVAFVAAGLRARIDAAGDDVVQALAGLVAPQVLLPVPAATIVELVPNMRALRARHRVPRGFEVRGASCRFRTCHDVDLRPLRVEEVRLCEVGPALELVLEVGEPEALGEGGPLRLFLHHADLSQAATLLLWLTRHLSGVTVRTPAGEVGRLPASAVAPLAAAGHAVLPWPEGAPAAHRAALELMVLPERHCFVEVSGLEALAPATGPVTLRFELERPPPLPAPLGPGCVRLHCAPAVNLFPAPGEPIARATLVREALVRADGHDPRQVEVYAVSEVHALGRERGRRALVPRSPGRGGDYSLRRAAAPGGEGVDTFLRVHDAAGAAPEGEVLSLELLCSNGGLPRGLRPGDLRDDNPGGLVRGCTNITPVTPPVPLALGERALWRLVGHLALGSRGPVDAEALRGLLRLFNVDPEGPRGRAGERRIAAIRGLRREAVTRVVRGAPALALRATLEVDEAAIGGPGAAFLFGHVLDDLFFAHLPIGCAGELQLALSPSQRALQWPVRAA